MAVAITSRPALWSAVKNPVVYKFATTGGPFTLYRIEVEVFDLDDNSLTGGVKFAYTPDPNGVTIADISAILRAVLKPDWTKPSLLSEAEIETGIGYYIRYQEVYDGSSESAQNDNSNPRYAVFGGLQIPAPVGNSMENYTVDGQNTGKKFLTKFTAIKGWPDYPQTLSFISALKPDWTKPSLKMLRRALDGQGGTIDTDEETLSDTSGSVTRIDLFRDINVAGAKTMGLDILGNVSIVTNPGFTGGMNPWTNEDTGGPSWSYTFDAVQATIATTPSDNLVQELSEVYSTGDYTLLLRMGTVGVTPGITVVVKLYLGNTEQQTIYNEPHTFTSILDYTEHFTANFPFNRIVAYMTKASGASANYIFSTIDILHEVPVTEALTFQLEPPCLNPVMLFWKNSLGGDAWWLFENDQEVNYELSGYKAKRMKLRAGNLTADQWDALNELNHIGEVYKQNIVEFTSSIDKSHLRDGAQVYVVQPNGDKVGVIVRPTNSVMFTRARRHEFEIEIEFPERYE